MRVSGRLFHHAGNSERLGFMWCSADSCSVKIPQKCQAWDWVPNPSMDVTALNDCECISCHRVNQRSYSRSPGTSRSPSHLRVRVLSHGAAEAVGFHLDLGPLLFRLLLLLTPADLLLRVVARVRAPERGQAAVHVDLGQAVLLALAAVPAPQARVAHGQGHGVAAGPPAVQREFVGTLAEPG